MDASFKQKIVNALKAKYRFRKAGGKWMQEGECPNCSKWEVYCAAEEPRVVKCGRANGCGYEESVREAVSELFEDWSERTPATEADPNATADEYLRSGRGLDLTGLRGHFMQEYYHDKKLNAGTATVRFPLPNDSWWERLIDRPGRFGKKARFKWGSNPGGHCWCHPEDSFIALAQMDEIWIAEGIFDALALRQNFKRLEAAGRKVKATAASAMSSNFWPEHFLAGLRQAIGGGKHRPELVFAFDVGPAGVASMKKFVDLAQREGWEAGAALFRIDGEGAKCDWNDLLDQQSAYRGDDREGPLSIDKLEEYRWNGAVTLAKRPYEKARLIHERRALSSFDFRFGNSIYWAKAKAGNEDDRPTLLVDEISSCAFRVLYVERDDIIDETNFFLQIDFPDRPTVKARFSNNALAKSAEFGTRLLAFTGMWLGSQEQLDRIKRKQLRHLKTVEPLHFTGYSETHNAWVLGEIAVRGGKVIPIGSEKYFDFGKKAVKLRTDERILSIDWNPDALDFSWIRDVWAAWGPRGIVGLAYFTLSLFSVQIRNTQESLGFLEFWGEPGSGKSTMVAFFWKLLGRKKYEGFDPNKYSVAAIARNFQKVSGLPVGIIESARGDEEGKQAHRAKWDWSELLTLFNGRSPRGTGVKSAGNETFEPPFLGSIYLMQNSAVNAVPAVMERIMSMEINKAHWTADSQPAARRLERWDSQSASRWIVHVTRQADDYFSKFTERKQYHEKVMAARVKEALSEHVNNGRVILNHSQLAAGVDVLRHLIPANLLPDEWLAETVAFVDRMALDRERISQVEHPIVEKFWGIFDYLEAMEGEAPEVPANLHRDTANVIAVSLERFQELARNRGQNPPTIDELRRHLKGSKTRKYIGQKPVNTRINRSMHCWVFQRSDNLPI